MKRRQFLQGVIAAGALMALPARPLWAAPEAEGRTLVVIHLAGGNDGLNTVIPYKDPTYARLRPSLAQSPGKVLPLERGLALHPNMTGLRTLYEKGVLAVVLGVGYPDPSFSHYRSTEIWNTAAPGAATEGWLGRFLDLSHTCEGIPAAAISPNPSLSLTGAHGPGLAFVEPDQFRLPASVAGVKGLYDRDAGLPGTRGLVGRQGREALEVAGRLARLHPAGEPHGPGLARDLRTALALLEADLGLEVLHLSMAGYDTHVNQKDHHGRTLGELSRSLAGYQQELERRGLSRRVVTVVFSEFGRRAYENSSGGTDHGTAGPVFLLGPSVKPGLMGSQPSLENLDAGNLRYTTDFRSLYAGLLAGWFGADPRPVVGDHPALPCIISQARTPA